MNTKYILFGIVATVIGLILMSKYKFYKYDRSDMLFATKLKVFLSSFILFALGLFLIINEVLKILK